MLNSKTYGALAPGSLIKTEREKWSKSLILTAHTRPLPSLVTAGLVS